MKNYSSSLSGLTETEKKALQKLVNRFKEYYGSNLSRVILYGSKARGDATEYSDIDILVVLKNMGPVYSEIKKMGMILAEVCLDYNLYIEALPIKEDRILSNEKTLFAENVLKEGISL